MWKNKIIIEFPVCVCHSKLPIVHAGSPTTLHCERCGKIIINNNDSKGEAIKKHAKNI